MSLCFKCVSCKQHVAQGLLACFLCVYLMFIYALEAFFFGSLTLIVLSGILCFVSTTLSFCCVF